MKKYSFILMFLLPVTMVLAQPVPYSSLHENFNASCGLSSVPSYWRVYTPYGTVPAGEWQCTATNGRPTSTSAPTPGMQCTGTYSSAYNIDTSYLLTPQLQLPMGATDVYLQFDTKTATVSADGLHVIIIDTPTFPVFTGTDITGTITPAFSPADSSGWVTHEANLSGYVGTAPFYIAFRYGSGTTAGTIWYLDNVNTSTTSVTLSASNQKADRLPLSIVSGSGSEIVLSYSAPEAGVYDLSLYDILGRLLYATKVHSESGRQHYTIDGLHLHAGMYFIKMGDSNTFGTTKVLIH